DQLFQLEAHVHPRPRAECVAAIADAAARGAGCHRQRAAGAVSERKRPEASRPRRRPTTGTTAARTLRGQSRQSLRLEHAGPQRARAEHGEVFAAQSTGLCGGSQQQCLARRHPRFNEQQSRICVIRCQ
nr:hypothetical protein [Tanacetum cinerariifolium]